MRNLSGGVAMVADSSRHLHATRHSSNLVSVNRRSDDPYFYLRFPADAAAEEGKVEPTPNPNPACAGHRTNPMVAAGEVVNSWHRSPQLLQETSSMYFTKILMRATALSVVGAAGMGYLSYRESARATELSQRGVTATASIEGIRWKNVGAGRSDFKLDVVFNSRDGESNHVTIPLDVERGRQISVEASHATTFVQYLPDDTAVARLVGAPVETRAGRYLLMACLATLLAVVCLWGGVRRSLRLRAISRLPTRQGS
jgi:hypothetical protein